MLPIAIRIQPTMMGSRPPAHVIPPKQFYKNVMNNVHKEYQIPRRSVHAANIGVATIVPIANPDPTQPIYNT